MTNKHFLFLVFILLFSGFAQAQNKFEGYNILLNVPEDHKSATCAIRYVPPTTDIIVTDLNPQTSMRTKPCGGSQAGTTLTQISPTTAKVNADGRNYRWCFEGEDEKYRISFKGDQYTGQVTYDWIATPDAKNLGTYNIRDFGAKGDGVSDDTLAIRSALAFITTHNGGILKFPEGDYAVYESLTLPSGITIEGINGIHTNAGTNNVVYKNPTRITLKKPNTALFRIGECTEKVRLRDIELYAEDSKNTFGVEALGAYSSTQDVYFDNVTFHRFYRGISVVGLPQTNLSWQFDYVKVNQCRFIFNTDAGIYTNLRNSDWKIQGTLFINPKRTPTQRADSMNFERVGGVLIEDTFGGGFPEARGGTYLNILDSGGITIIGSQTESMTNSIVYNEVENPSAGDYSYPITIIGSLFGDPIIFKARRTFVSTGSVYGAATFKADKMLRVYSTGDRFCYDGFILGCVGGTKNNFDNATVIFMTGQPGETKVKGHPTYFGYDVEFGTPIQLPNLKFIQLPNDKPNGSFLYCEDCQRNGNPCRGNGSGSPAMVVNGRWSCL